MTFTFLNHPLIQRLSNYRASLLFVLGIALVACAPQDDTPSIVDNSVDIPIPLTFASVDNPLLLKVSAFVKEDQANAAETEIPMRINVVGNDVTAEGDTSMFVANKTYRLRMEISYPYNGKTVRLINTPSKLFSTIEGANGSVIGNVTFANTDFNDRSYYPDDDLDGYTNMFEIDRQRGTGKTDPFDAFDYPGQSVLINAPRKLSVVVCPLLNSQTIGQLKQDHGIANYAISDYRYCSNDAKNNFSVIDSGDVNATDKLQLVMASDIDFFAIPMAHPQFIPFTGLPNYTRIYTHGSLVDGNSSAYYNSLDTNCVFSAGNYSCSHIKAALANANNAHQPVAPVFFISEHTRSPEQTEFLPTWLRLESNVNESQGTSNITISWEDLYTDTNRDITYELLRSTEIATKQIDSWSANSSTPGAQQVTGYELVSPIVLASSTVDANSTVYNLSSDAGGHGTITYVDANPAGGVLYYYALHVTTADSLHNVYSEPVGISTYAGLPHIEGDERSSVLIGDVNGADVPDPQNPGSFLGVKLSLNAPVAYGVNLDIYYIKGDNTTLTAANKDDFISQCLNPPNPTSVFNNCVHMTATGGSYDVQVPAGDLPAAALVVKIDRYGRSAGFQIRSLTL